MITGIIGQLRKHVFLVVRLRNEVYVYSSCFIMSSSRLPLLFAVPASSNCSH